MTAKEKKLIETKKFRKAVRIIAITLTVLAILGGVLFYLEQRPAQIVEVEKTRVKVLEVVEVVEVVQEVEVSEIDWDWYTVTAYTQQDAGVNNITSIGLDYDRSWTEHFEFVAVDPSIIPYGSTVFIKYNNDIIQALAVDTGGRIVGKRIDWYMESLEEAYQFGVQELEVGVVR